MKCDSLNAIIEPQKEQTILKENTAFNFPLVSIIIPTHNSAGTLMTALKSVETQTYPNKEIIVVDNKSADETIRIAKERKCRLFKKEGGLAIQLNFGVTKAKGQYIYFMDSDMEITPKVIQECVRLCENTGADGVLVSEICSEKTFWQKCRGLEKKLNLGDEKVECVRFVKKSIYEKIGGYDETLAGYRDYDFDIKFTNGGFKKARCKYLVIHHVAPSLRDVTLKRYHRGKALKKYIKSYPSQSLSQFLFKKSYLKLGFYMVRDPLVFFGFITIRMVEYTTSFLALLVSLVD